MKRTIALKLNVSAQQEGALVTFQELFSRACHRVAEVAVEKQEINRTRLHHLSYYLLREEFPAIGAQMCCNAIAKTAHALKALKKPREILFRKGASVHFDKRTYSLKNGILSLFTLEGKVRFPLKISAYHAHYLNQGKVKEAEWIRKGKRWFFHLVLKRVRSRLHRWAFDELRQCIAYKAEAEGIGVVYINPAYTSLTCSCCLSQGHRLKHHFFCSHCGSRQQSDLNASQN